jgi:hypothetical protein
MYSWLKQQVVGSNPASNLKLFMLVLNFSLLLLQLSFLHVEIPQDVTIINDKYVKKYIEKQYNFNYY